MSDFLPLISVPVTYRYFEYRRMMKEYLPGILVRQSIAVNRRLPWNWPVTERVVLAVVLPFLYLLKKWRVGSCHFEFGADGFRRTAKGHAEFFDWTQVAVISRFAEVYMIELCDGGGMPVPYRSFPPGEREAFDALLGTVGGADESSDA